MVVMNSIVLPSNPYIEVLTPVFQNVTAFEDRVFEEVINVK